MTLVLRCSWLFGSLAVSLLAEAQGTREAAQATQDAVVRMNHLRL